jgi:hypothetical protein
MAGYEQYRMTDWGWIETYQHKMGSEQFRTYRDCVRSSTSNETRGIFRYRSKSESREH